MSGSRYIPPQASRKNGTSIEMLEKLHGKVSVRLSASEHAGRDSEYPLLQKLFETFDTQCARFVICLGDCGQHLV